MTVRTQAMDYLEAQLPTLETTPSLVRGAIAIAMADMPGLDPQAVEHEIAQITATIEQQLHSDDPRAILARAHAVLFEDMKFLGDVKDYYNPANSYLPRVLDRRRGLPITLTLLYKAVLDPLGIEVTGIDAPMHFLAGVDDGSAGGMYIDPFVGGRLLTADEVFDRIAKSGQPVERDLACLAPTNHQQWLLRLLRNLIAAFDRLADRDRQIATAEMYARVEEGS